MDAVGRRVAVEEGLDVDDNLLAHVDAALESGGAHMRQHHHLLALWQLRIDRRLVLEHIETSARKLPILDHAANRLLPLPPPPPHFPHTAPPLPPPQPPHP